MPDFKWDNMFLYNLNKVHETKINEKFNVKLHVILNPEKCFGIRLKICRKRFYETFVQGNVDTKHIANPHKFSN